MTRLSRPSPASSSSLASEFTEKITPLDRKGHLLSPAAWTRDGREPYTTTNGSRHCKLADSRALQTSSRSTIP